MNQRRKPDIARPKTKQTEILEAAVQFFLEKGYANTTIQEIADYACLGKGTVYTYYKSKDELFLDSIEYIMSKILQQIKNDCAIETTFLHKLDIYMNAVQKVVHDNHNGIKHFFANSFSDFTYQSLEQIEIFCQNFKEEMANQCLQILSQGVAEGKLDNQNIAFASQMISSFIFIHCERCCQLGFDEIQQKTENDKLKQFILHGLYATSYYEKQGDLTE